MKILMNIKEIKIIIEDNIYTIYIVNYCSCTDCFNYQVSKKLLV